MRYKEFVITCRGRMYYDRFKSIRLANLEILRGKQDARLGRQPAMMVGYYYDGYMSVGLIEKSEIV